MKKKYVYENEDYFGEVDENGSKNGLGFFEDRNRIYAGQFKNDVFNGYGFSKGSAHDKTGDLFGYFSGNEINGLGLKNDRSGKRFGYFSHNKLESGFIIRSDEIQMVYKKYKNVSLNIHNDKVYFSVSGEASNIHYLKKDFSFVDFEEFNIPNSFFQYDLKYCEDNNSILCNQVSNTTIVGFGLRQYKDDINHFDILKAGNIFMSSNGEYVEYFSSRASLKIAKHSNYATLKLKRFSNIFEFTIKNNVLSLSIKVDEINYQIQLDSYLNLNIKRYNCNALTLFEEDKFIIKDSDDVEEYNEHAEEELMNMIGLESVKRQINRIKCFVKKNKNKKINLHMAFLGNPGTGKTTVAKLIADIFYKYKVLKTPKMINANRRMLVGTHVGETSIKAKKIIDDAMGGVLIVDEAYALDGKSERDFGKEAISVLLTEMENNKGDFCCILAGYSKEMYKLFDVNPGFKSRIQYIINFEDYTAEELRLIAIQQAKKNHLNIAEDVMKKIVSILEFQKENTQNFGNARDVRNIIEQLAMIATDREKNTHSIILEDVYKYMSENTLVDKRIKRVPMIGYDELQGFYNKNYKPTLYKNNKIDLIESVIQIVNSYDDITVRKAGFIISPNGYAVTSGINYNECISSEAVRHIFDRKGNEIDVYSNVSIASRSPIASIIKLYNDGDFYSYAPLIDSVDIKDFLNKKVIVIGPLSETNNSTTRNFAQKIGKVSTMIDSTMFEITFTENVIFMEGCPVIDYNTGFVVGVMKKGNKALSSKALLHIIRDKL